MSLTHYIVFKDASVIRCEIKLELKISYEKISLKLVSYC